MSTERRTWKIENEKLDNNEIVQVANGPRIFRHDSIAVTELKPGERVISLTEFRDAFWSSGIPYDIANEAAKRIERELFDGGEGGNR